MVDKYTQVRTLKNEGKSTTEIARITGYTRQYILTILKTKGIMINQKYQNLSLVPIDTVFTFRNKKFKAVTRTSCSDCIVNKDHSLSPLCMADSCDAIDRNDRTDVMFIGV